ncbi:hypothetical protein A8950_3832 [Dongia mobilis]|uniref:Uncharacterized protein n=1 Tax=Dongia mobilis TaxID=578943 RepID=A0A4R6WDE4_9PROT|nr:hypothetical protein [Dongia mobilis]TDQ77677.1 hypothetical protein A8950_3832 [Dongia mobilis]
MSIKARRNRRIRKLAATLILAACSACSNIGPEALPRDRIDYAGAIGDSWKQQTLLNIVKLRYADFPVFLDINQVVAGYEFNSSVTAGVNASATNQENPAPSFLTLGGSVLLQGGYKDQPTVIYAPATGSEFITRLMTPIPPSAVLFLLQAGYRADRVLPLTLDSVNGLNNASMRRGDGGRQPDADFIRLGELISDVQNASGLEVRILRSPDGKEATAIIFQPSRKGAELEEKREEIARILGIQPTPQEIKVLYGGYSGRDDEIAMTTRSMLQIMMELGIQAEVPSQDVAEGRALPSGDLQGAVDAAAPMLHIMSGPQPPVDAYVAVPYRGHWFWIPDTDLRSKTTFASVMLLFSISDQGTRSNTPVVTINTR